MRSPDQFLDKLYGQVWETPRKRQAALIGKDSHRVSLSAPKVAAEIVKDFPAFRQWVNSWRKFEHQLPEHSITWKTKRCSPHGELTYPVGVTLTPPQAIKTISNRIADQYEAFNSNFELLAQGFEKHEAEALLRAVLLVNDTYHPNPVLFKGLNILLPQIKRGIGKGQYLRSICFKGIHTKFLEKHSSIVRALYGALRLVDLPTHESFMHYLDAVPTPFPNISLHAFDLEIQNQLLGLDLMGLSSAAIQRLSIKVETIVVVENPESAYAFSHLPNTLIFAGGGKDTTFLQADYIQSATRVLYWGDIDTHGFICLAAARRYCPKLQSILMTREMFDAYEADYGVKEESPTATNLQKELTPEELDCYEYILNKQGHSRLEQQYIPLDLIHKEIQRVAN